MLVRHLTPALLAALSDTPVVLIVGARQVGKSTLARLADPARTELTLDDLATLGAAQGDPTGFIAGLAGPVLIDEVQRAPELFLPLKAAVDRARTPGRFLLTGSANVLSLPRLADSLAGRLEVLHLWPLSQGELSGTRDAFIDAAFGDAPPLLRGPAIPLSELLERLVAGGYPEATARSGARRTAWFRSYLDTLLQRDVRDLANIEGLRALPQLLALLATRTGTLQNIAELSRTADLPQTTLKRYLALLEAVYLTTSLPAWSGNLSKRLVKSPKSFLSDTGLAAHLLGVAAARLARDHRLLGPLLETFVVLELMKMRGWNDTPVNLYHYRTQTGQEVDVVLEAADGRLVGVEVKSSATVTSGDFRGLRALQEAAAANFQRGVVLYNGDTVVPFGARLHAVPIRALWQWTPITP